MKLESVRSWPAEVPSGSFTVKIYRIKNKGRRSFMVSYLVGADWKQKMFVDFEEAYQEAKDSCKDVKNGETNGINLANADRVIFCHASEAVVPTGVPLDVAARDWLDFDRWAGCRGLQGVRQAESAQGADQAGPGGCEGDVGGQAEGGREQRLHEGAAGVSEEVRDEF